MTPGDDADRRQRLLTAALMLEPGEREELLAEVEAALARIDQPVSHPIGAHHEEALDAHRA